MDEGELVMQKMVREMAESSKGQLERPSLSEPVRRLVPVLMQRGLDDMNLSMLSPELKQELINHVGNEYLRKGNVKEAKKAFIKIRRPTAPPLSNQVFHP